MCTLMTTADMPTGKATNAKKEFIAWFPKPNKEGENARVRLLWFLQQSKNDRDKPYFTQVVHQHWGIGPNNMKIVDDFVVCPGSQYVHYNEEKYVLNEKTGKKYLNCPICQKEKEAMAVWKSSGWKDKLAMKRHYELQQNFRAIIPVYVINDPNNTKNNGHMKVMILTNKEDYDLFDNVVKTEKAKAYAAAQEGHPYEIFNGVNGVDLYLHCETLEVQKKNGYIRTERKMTGIAFDDPANKYDIPDICKEAIDGFTMDEEFYISNTKQELESFYRKYFGKNETVIPKENVDIFKKNKPITPPINIENPIPQPKVEPKIEPSIEIEEPEFEPIKESTEEIKEPVEDSEPSMSQNEIENLLSEID